MALTPAMPMNSFDFDKRFAELRAARRKEDDVVEHLLAYARSLEEAYAREREQLTQTLDETKLDLSDATKSRRELQQSVRFYENELNRLTHENESLKLSLAESASSHPYVAILIDGDGLNFQDHFIRQGVDGGKRAAHAVRAAILEQCGDQTGIEVWAKIIVNMTGLSRTLSTAVSPGDLQEFMFGFTQSMPFFEVVDAGSDKEQAVIKLKEFTKSHLRHLNCRQILLGVSHDASYGPFLESVLGTDEIARQRVTVIEGVPTVKELRATGVNTFKLPRDIFRTERLLERALPDRSLPASSTTSPSVGFAATVTPLTAPSGPASIPANSPLSSYAGIAQQKPPTPQPTPAAAKSKPASPPPQMTMPLAPRSANAGSRTKQTNGSSAPATTSQPKWNPGPRGLDKPIPINSNVLEAVKKRKDNNKLCNNHFLRGPCSKGDSCSFVHKYRPSPDELSAIAYLSRLNPCTSGQDCDADDCIYGHHCPSLKDNTCLHPYCKFPTEAHPPGTKYRNAHIDKNN